MKEHHLEVRRTARYWTLGNERDPAEVWFVLHGYKQLARRFLRRFGAIEATHRLFVAPEALSRFYVSEDPGRHGPTSMVGATWMTREDRANEIADYVAYLDRLADVVDGALDERADRRRVVLGFSQGVATATRWVVHGEVRPHRLILWGDFVPPDLDLDRARSAWAGVDVVAVRGSHDASLSPSLARDEGERLEGAGVELRSMRYDGGHDLHAGTLETLADLA